jgi:hypothetical protein
LDFQDALDLELSRADTVRYVAEHPALILTPARITP